MNLAGAMMNQARECLHALINDALHPPERRSWAQLSAGAYGGGGPIAFRRMAFRRAPPQQPGGLKT
ncbi:predicted protein [Chaetomium globosum CBS 148.51]|uniref:Uncharacterized protein n=1 Tax=Chaetomium globosum (strain ATCC 6205 / CBS 148.51 / DSM 1962 / NBRC 6347 / NRRL 1970) TaxID=306901 RepID=Q2GRD8_CHAGB|nr:uncharacterized protein CHGG_09466 [Chaetomium globosum CBS 148.51]EAQ85452.1 predicted protein [Chaetomium globosum CBS 148.51]